MPNCGPVVVSSTGGGSSGRYIDVWVQRDIVMNFAVGLCEDFELNKEYVGGGFIG
jgi:hypothetical protein